jgi:hypothetical protein
MQQINSEGSSRLEMRQALLQYRISIPDQPDCNYAPSIICAYIRTVEHFARHFHCPADRLGPEHLRQYQAAMFRTWKLAPNLVLIQGLTRW